MKGADAAVSSAFSFQGHAGLIPTGHLAPWQCKRLRAYIEANLAQPLVLSILADVVSLSTSHFCRAFRQSFGVTPHRFVMQRRLERAQALMISTSESLSSIAASCGLADQSHMTHWFRRLIGQTPAAWRRANCDPVFECAGAGAHMAIRGCRR